jgi:hypothetical protein
MKLPIRIKIAIATLQARVRRGPAGKGKSGFAFKDKTKYNRKIRHRVVD